MTERPGVERRCSFVRGLDGWTNCATHGWTGYREEVKRVVICPEALRMADFPEPGPESILPPITPIEGLDLRKPYDLLSPEAKRGLDDALRADARTRRAAAGAAATIPLAALRATTPAPPRQCAICMAWVRPDQWTRHLENGCQPEDATPAPPEPGGWVTRDLRPVPPGPWRRQTGLVPDEDEHGVYLVNDAGDSLILNADDVAELANARLVLQAADPLEGPEPG